MNCYNKRPDGCITISGHEKINIGFIEVKEEAHKNSATKMNKDLDKFGLFSKNAID